jgi:hypothetical protein
MVELEKSSQWCSLPSFLVWVQKLYVLLFQDQNPSLPTVSVTFSSKCCPIKRRLEFSELALMFGIIMANTL